MIYLLVIPDMLKYYVTVFSQECTLSLATFIFAPTIEVLVMYAQNAHFGSDRSCLGDRLGIGGPDDPIAF
jgi:hypothetical protein